MDLKLSSYGRKLTSRSGILELMDDLSDALTRPGVLMPGEEAEKAFAGEDVGA